jgi:hypothetical protein
MDLGEVGWGDVDWIGLSSQLVTFRVVLWSVELVFYLVS